MFTNKINKSKANYFKKKGVTIIYLNKMIDKDDYMILFKKIKASLDNDELRKKPIPKGRKIGF